MNDQDVIASKGKESLKRICDVALALLDLASDPGYPGTKTGLTILSLCSYAYTARHSPNRERSTKFETRNKLESPNLKCLKQGDNQYKKCA
jgi:hypothetical protein